ncbi:MAG: PaaI family thioesterase [Frankiales bacterium]|nr:PaaI family thioesterase [Frankiales bacterium]
MHIAGTIGMRIIERGDGRSAIGWDASPEYGFPSSSGQIIHGGMVTTILDTAMGAATWSVLTADEVFLTADLRVEFYRATRPGPLVAKGSVIKRTSRLAFCSAELFDADDRLLASSRGTQTILPATGAMARPDPTSREFA